MLATICAAVTMGIYSQPNHFASWGKEALTQIDADFWMPDEKLYGNDRTMDKPTEDVAFNWGVGVLLSAFNAAAKADNSYKPKLKAYAEEIKRYWNPAPPVAGFDVLPGPKEPDRYYDDNAWMVLSLVETSEVLNDKPSLELARKALTFVMSGEDDVLGGGIYWRESDKASKNTCANGPSVAAMLAVYAHTKEPNLLAHAKSVYSWTKSNLEDPEDHLFWDAINIKDKSIGKYKWTYNTALMIRSAKALYGITKDKTYLDDAARWQEASLKNWFVDGGKGGVRCEAKFAHLLTESFQWSPRYEPGIKARDLALTFVHQNTRDSLGRYHHRWDETVTKPISKFEMIDQASAARAFWIATQH